MFQRAGEQVLGWVGQRHIADRIIKKGGKRNPPAPVPASACAD
jgi:hypothetical protein